MHGIDAWPGFAGRTIRGIREDIDVTGRGDKFIKLGFWSQLILLALVDWGSILAFMEHPVAWYHYVGFALINIGLLYATYVMWGWLKPQSAPDIAFGAPKVEE